MKKRLLSVLLTICMVASIFSGLGVTAFADVETTEYTLKEGDNVYSVCQKLGIDFYANYDWITSTNKITNYSALGVGKKIILPLGEVADTTPPATTPTPDTGSTTVTTPAKNNVNLLTGDTVASYLVPYVVSSGDTLYDICLREGISYNDTIDTIKKINGLKNENRIQVGRTILLPSATMPTSGACVAVVAHKIVSGDATYNLCSSYNIDYEDNVDLMKALNGKDNMAVIKTGQTLYIPVPTSITPATTTTTPSGSGSTNTGSNSGNTDSSDKTDDKDDNETEEPTTPAPVSYKITKNTPNALHGSYTVLVNNSYASEAKAGDTVTVNVSAKEGHKMDKVVVLDSNGKSVALNDTTFTMPASDVSIEVVFVSSVEYHITDKAAKNGIYTVKVNGSEVNNAAEGQTVVIETQPSYGYELRKIEVINKKTNEAVAVTDKSFTMPASAVTITVTFGEAYNHAINVARQTADGTVKVKFNGAEVNKAKAGETLTIEVTPNDGYELGTLKVEPVSGNDTIALTNNSFVMPEYDVNVVVSFKAQDFNIKSAASTNGTFTVLDGSTKEIASAGTAKGIYVKAAPAAGYVVDKVTYTDYNGKVTEVSLNGDYYYFTMPASDVTVNVTFKARVFYLSAHAESPAATFTVGGKETTKAYMGETVTVNGNPAAGVKVKEIKAYNTSNVEIPMTTSNTLVMPAGNVCFKVTYELMDLAINKASTSNGSFSFKKTDANGDAITTAHMGDKVYVASSPANGYHTSKITVTDAKNVVTDITADQTFTMPSSAVTVTVTYAAN